VGGGVVQVSTAQATRQIQDSLGSSFVVDRTAQQIFDDQNPPGTPAADNVFVAVNQLRVALEANDTTGLQNAEGALTQAGDYLNQQLGFYGAAQNRVAAATDLSQQMDVNFQTTPSSKSRCRYDAGHFGSESSAVAGKSFAHRARRCAKPACSITWHENHRRSCAGMAPCLSPAGRRT